MDIATLKETKIHLLLETSSSKSPTLHIPLINPFMIYHKRASQCVIIAEVLWCIYINLTI